MHKSRFIGKGCKLFGISVGNVCVYCVKGLQNQIRRTCGAVKGQCGFRLGHHIGVHGRNVQICASCQHGQGFVCGIAADIRPEIDGMAAGSEESEIRPVSIVYSQQSTAAVADLGDFCNIRTAPEIIR